MLLRRSLKNPISLQTSTLRIPCVTSLLRNVGKRGSARKRSRRSTRMKHPRRDERGRNARGKRRRRKSCCRESRTPCAMWKSCSSLWGPQGTTEKEWFREGVEAEVFHRLGETVTGLDGVGPPNRIPLVRAGGAQAGPGPHGGGETLMVFARQHQRAFPVPLCFAYSKGCVVRLNIQVQGCVLEVAVSIHSSFPVRPFFPRC